MRSLSFVQQNLFLQCLRRIVSLKLYKRQRRLVDYAELLFLIDPESICKAALLVVAADGGISE